ncbi:MAG: hypothetical protein NVS3B12_04840 [Acidimicrobiales bacterium]
MIGASFDQPADNKVFADAQDFGFALVSDVTRTVGAAYEVLRSDGDQYIAFPLRLSYLIGPDGLIRRSYAVSDVAGHADEVLRDLKLLGGGS